MKKCYLSLFVFLFTVIGVYSQRVVGDQIDFRNEIPAINDAREVTDSLPPVYADGCDPTPILLGAEGGGFVAGGNSYGDLEKAQYIETEGSGLVHSVLVWVGAKEGGTGSEMYSAKLYDGDIVDGPADVWATSQPVSYMDLDTVGIFTRFTFDPPVAYDGSFFVSYEVADGDAIYGIIHTDDGCGNTTAWEMWDNMNWFDINSAWGDLDIVMYTLAEVEMIGVGIEDAHMIEKGSDQVFPNPVSSHANLIYNVTEASEIDIHIYSPTGVLVKTYQQGVLHAGMNQLTIDTQNYSPGMYIYSIQTEDGLRNGRFNVVR